MRRNLRKLTPEQIDIQARVFADEADTGTAYLQGVINGVMGQSQITKQAIRRPADFCMNSSMKFPYPKMLVQNLLNIYERHIVMRGLDPYNVPDYAPIMLHVGVWI